jgi:exopolysaccharide production protein ExoQ
LALAFSFGTVAILFFLLPWAFVAARQPSTAVLGIYRNLPLLALPFLALLSTSWSDYPDLTLRASIQFIVTTIVGIMAGYCVKPRHLISALFSALALVTLLSVLFGSYQTAFSANQYALVGLFGSKNQMGLYVALLLVVAATVLLDRSQPRPFRVVAFTAVLCGPPILLLALSTSALIVSVVVTALIPLLRFTSRTSPMTRAAIFFSGVFLIVLGIILSLFVDLATFMDFLGKDASLTGRTAFWDTAITSISERPFLGTGYQAFWQPGNTAAERIWYQFHLATKTGLTFHNTYLHIAVDLGLVAICLLLITFAAIFVRILSAFLTVLTIERTFAICIFVFILIRSPVEIDFFFQFWIGSVLICLVWIYLTPSRPPSFRNKYRMFKERSGSAEFFSMN